MRNPFRLPSPLQLATQELEAAKRELLLAASAREYAQAMVQYHEARIARLRGAIRDLSTEDENISEKLGEK